jgi:mannobiose 2-epimerase
MNQLINELMLLRKQFETELQDNILSFWLTKSRRPDMKGFWGAADIKGNPVPTATQSCVLNARILWTFSAAAKLYNKKEYSDMAHLAYEVLSHRFADPQQGGYFMELEADFSIANDIKHTYVQAFALYALCKYYEFNPSKAVLTSIQSFFQLLEMKCKDPEGPGYLEAFTRDWQLYAENRMADNNEPKSMNTHLHILEAYAALYHIWKDDHVKQRLTELMQLFIERIIRSTGHLGIFFDEQFNETDTSKGICSFGHDIEASWLLYEAAEILGHAEILEQMKAISVKMANAVDRVGLDKDGGLFLESTRFGSHIKTNKHWWLQAETLVGFMNAYEISDDDKHWEAVKLSWKFIRQHVIDKQHGEWFTKVNRLGIPYLTEPADDPSPYYRNDWKIDPWKCPYHNGRAMMELIQRIDKLISIGKKTH